MQSHGEGGGLYIVGTGPGGLDQMTGRAAEVIKEADCVIGNESYLSGTRPAHRQKEVIRSGMGREVERAETAVRLASNRRVAIVSGGDAGVYGMASIVLEVIEERHQDFMWRSFPVSPRPVRPRHSSGRHYQEILP